MTLNGVDVASYQGPPAEWRAAAGAIAYAAVKLTELGPGGSKYVNPDAAADWAYLKAQGKGRIGYLFGHPATGVAETVALFRATIEALGVEPGDGVMLDHEVSDGLSPDKVSAWAGDVMAELHAAFSRSPLVYTYIDFAVEGNCAGLGGYMLFIADPSSPEGHPRVPEPWKGWVMHQYSTAGGIDRDIASWATAEEMRKALGRVEEWRDFTTAGEWSLKRIATAASTTPLAILDATERRHPGQARLTAYINDGNLSARMPAGIVLRVPPSMPPRKPKRRPVRKAVRKTAALARTAVSATHAKVRAEPAMTATGTAGGLAALLAFVLPHLGLHLTVTEVRAVLTALPAAGTVVTALLASPPRVSVLTGAVATIATAALAFGIHLPVHVIAAEMPVLATIAGLLLRGHLTPNPTTVPTSTGAST